MAGRTCRQVNRRAGERAIRQLASGSRLTRSGARSVIDLNGLPIKDTPDPARVVRPAAPNEQAPRPDPARSVQLVSGTRALCGLPRRSESRDLTKVRIRAQ